MGLSFNKPNPIKDGSKIVVSAIMPPYGSPLAKELWDLYKASKDDIKKDGFSIKKENWKGNDIWKVNYWHTVNANTYEKNEEGEFLWKTTFDSKVKKWDNHIKKSRNLAPEKEEELFENMQQVFEKKSETSKSNPPKKETNTEKPNTEKPKKEVEDINEGEVAEYFEGDIICLDDVDD